jgi:chromosome segregation ATPase
LIDKIKDDEQVLREKAGLVQKLKADNDKADRVIRDLARQSDFNQMELDKIKEEIEQERRRTLAQEEGYNRKLKALEDQKRKLEDKIKAENTKNVNYQTMLKKANDDREEERRQTMHDHESIMRNLDRAKKEKEELQRFLEETEQEKNDNENRIKQMKGDIA